MDDSDPMMTDMPIVKLPAARENLEELLDCIRSFAKQIGFDYQKCWELELIADEVLTNIINHAYPETNGFIEIRCSYDESAGARIEFLDSGIPFNLLQLPERDPEPDLQCVCTNGFGVSLIRRLADRLDYHRNGDQNRLVLCKKNCKLSQA